MKPIGDVLKNLNIQITRTSNGSPEETPEWRCPICQDTGFYILEVPVGHPQFGRLQKCNCRKVQDEARKAGDLRSLSNLNLMAHLTFENFDETVPGVEDAYEAARAFARDPDGWLLLRGPIGSGKTHLAVATALEMIERFDSPVLFMVVPDLLDHLRAAFDPSKSIDYDERFEQVKTANILVLDDLGTENATPWAREKLFQIFNYRYNERLPIIVTTNVDLRPGNGRSQASGAIDERIRSRLLDERTTYAELDAEDYRTRKRPPQLKQLRR
ncbi:MAG: ATP-binding protein [Thermomicrobiales bacterium]|nr:ATP-binding protein [Thermomicrobiales bacterium]